MQDMSLFLQFVPQPFASVLGVLTSANGDVQSRISLRVKRPQFHFAGREAGSFNQGQQPTQLPGLRAKVNLDKVDWAMRKIVRCGVARR